MLKNFIPFHKPYVTDEEVNEVVDSIKSGWWTTGPKALRFEEEFKNYIGAKHCLAVNSWTSAAHLAFDAIGLQKDDEVIVPAFTFTATAEIVCYFGAKPVITDVDPESFNISAESFAKAISRKTKAVIPVHYGGNPCDMDEIIKISDDNKLKIIEDAAHALPSEYKGKKIGTVGDVTCFSFYVTKTLATGEGGMICTDNDDIAERCSIMRLHGINKDVWDRYSSEGSWYYEVVAPGYKYNFSDLNAALGLAQLKKIDFLNQEREKIYNLYCDGFKDNGLLKTYKIKNDRRSSHHLYPVLLELEKLTINRNQFIQELKELGVGTSVHFIPLYRHPFYRDEFKLSPKDYPVSEYIYERIVTLPIWPGMKNDEILKVIDIVNSVLDKYKK